MSISLWILAIAVVVIGYYNVFLGLAGALLLGYLVYHNLHAASRQKEELRLYIENLSENVDTATKNAILNLPFPWLLLMIRALSIGIICFSRVFFKESTYLTRAVFLFKRCGYQQDIEK